MTDLAKLQHDGLSIGPDTPPDAIAEVLNTLSAMKQRIREVERSIKDRLLEVIQETRRDIVVGSVRYYAGNESDTTPNDHAAALEALFVACGGDFAKVAQCLASNAFKVGACRVALDAEFGRHFTTTKREVLKDGKPVKQLMSIDERFTKGGK